MDAAYGWWRRATGDRRGEVALLALVALVTGLMAYLAGARQEHAGWALLGAAVAALAWRRRFPRLVLGLTLASSVAYYVLGFAAGPESVPFVVALYHAAAAGRRRVAIGAAVLAVAVVRLADAVTLSRLAGSEMLAVVAWLCTVIVAGELSRSRQEYLRQVEERARQAERTREAEASRRVAEERLRLARELHDSLGHHLTVMTMHAGAALLRRSTRPEFVDEALETIRSAGRDALRELRGTVRVLRTEPSLEHLQELVRRAGAAGPAVAAEVVGDRRDLPAPVEHAAYRIVQEALTNATRHAAATSVRVSVCYEPEHLVLRIDDDGRGGAGAPLDGSGLTGMRERAAAVGGQLRAGPRSGGGFGVYARLPTRGAA